MDLSDDTLDAIADRVISRIGLTVPRSIKDAIRVDTSQRFNLNYIAKQSDLWFPQVQLDFTDAGVWLRWCWPNGSVASVHFLPWGD